MKKITLLLLTAFLAVLSASAQDTYVYYNDATNNAPGQAGWWSSNANSYHGAWMWGSGSSGVYSANSINVGTHFWAIKVPSSVGTLHGYILVCGNTDLTGQTSWSTSFRKRSPYEYGTYGTNGTDHIEGADLSKCWFFDNGDFQTDLGQSRDFVCFDANAVALTPPNKLPKVEWEYKNTSGSLVTPATASAPLTLTSSNASVQAEQYAGSSPYSVTTLCLGGGEVKTVSTPGQQVTVKIGYKILNSGGSEVYTGEIPYVASASASASGSNRYDTKTWNQSCNRFTFGTLDNIIARAASALTPGSSYKLNFWFQAAGNSGVTSAYFSNWSNDYTINFSIPANFNQINVADIASRWKLMAKPFANAKYSDFTFGAHPGVSMMRIKNTPTSGGNYTWTWEAIPDANANLPLGVGFAYSVNGRAQVSANNPAPYSDWHNGAIVTLATPNTAAVSTPISFQGRYFVAGNPFNSSIQFNQKFNGTIKNGFLVLHEEATNTFSAVNCEGNDHFLGSKGQTFDVKLPNSTIAAYEGIIVEASNSAGGQYTISNSSTPLPAPAYAPLSVIKIEAATAATGSHYTLVQNNENGSATVGNNDISFLNMGVNSTVQLYTVKNNENGAAQQLGLNTVNTDNATIPVSIFTTYAGDATITLTGMDTYLCDVALVDNLNGAYIDLTDMESYTYETTVSGSEQSRFSLVLSPKVPTAIEELLAKVSVWVTDGKINIISDRNIDNVAVYSVDGGQVYFSNVQNVKSTEISTAALPAGVYMVKANGKINKVVVK
ncbi:MAG: T9SS type A sorting domain-containing protein [Paludibacter sp.]|nr:T9SS type A sorting domain-containing protein [Paludibacter sp.]